MPVPLVERSKEEIAQIIRKMVEEIKDIRGCHQVSVRMTGKRIEVDMHVLLDSNLRFEAVHKIASDVEREVKNVFPNARVTVHTEPVKSGREGVWKLVKEVAEGVPGSRGIHNIHIQKIDGKICVDLHLEVSANMSLKQAHEVADQVEGKLRASIPNIADITIHIESASSLISKELTATETELRSYVEHAAKSFPEIKSVQEIVIRKIGNSQHLVLRCCFDPNVKIKQAHEVSNRLEKMIRNAYPNIERIDIHEEPT